MNAATVWKRLSSAAFVIGLSHLALELCNNFLPVVYPLLIESMGLNYAQVGSVALVIGVFGALTQPLFGYLSDRWDPRLIIVLSIAWIGTLMGLVGFMERYWLLMPIVGLGALGSAAFHPAGASLASAGATERRGAALSVFSVGGNLGAALSPLLVGAVVIRVGLRGTAVLIPLGLGASFLLYRRFRRLSLAEEEGSFATSKPDRSQNEISYGSWLALGLIVLVVAMRSWVQGTLITYLPEWLQSGGRSLEAAGSMLSVLLVSVGLGSLTGGTLSDRIGRVPVIVASLLMLSLAQWLFFNTGGGLQVLLASLIGVTIGATFPVTIVMAQEVWPEAVGLASALVIGVGWLPAGLGSWVMGLVADQTSLTFALGLLGFFPMVGIAAVLIFKFRY